MDGPVVATLASAILGLLVLFQLLLAVGMPWGRLAWGGGHRILPPRLRVASVIAAFVYIGAAMIVLGDAGYIELPWTSRFVQVVVAVFALLFLLGVPMNAISRSKSERIMAPVALVLALLFGAVAIGP